MQECEKGGNLNTKVSDCGTETTIQFPGSVQSKRTGQVAGAHISSAAIRIRGVSGDVFLDTRESHRNPTGILLNVLELFPNYFRSIPRVLHNVGNL